MRIAALVAIVAVTLVSSIFLGFTSCIPPKTSKPVESVTGKDGAAVLSINGKSLTVTVSDQTNQGRVLPGVKVSAAEQQGVGLVYASDSSGKYYPQLAFLNSGLSQAAQIKLQLQPAGSSKWQAGTAFEVGINPDTLPKSAEKAYSELPNFLKSSYPTAKAVVFLSTGRIAKIDQCWASVCSSPFAEVVYVYLHQDKKAAGLNFMPGVYAAPRGGTFAVVITILVATPIDDMIVVGGLGYAATKFDEAFGESMIYSSVLKQIQYCRFECKLHGLWASGLQTDPTIGHQDWAYVRGNFNDRVFTGQSETKNGLITVKMLYQIGIDSILMKEIETADYKIQIETFDPNYGPDEVWKIKGSNVERRKDKESAGELYFQLDGSEIEFSLAPDCELKSQVYAGVRASTVKKMSWNSGSYIKIGLSPTVQKSKK